MVMVTHEKDIALYCRRLINVKDGRVLGDTPVSNPGNAAEDLAAIPEEREALT